MTRILSLIFLLLACIHCEAQKISFTDASNRWTQYFWSSNGPPEGTISDLNYNGDTVINGTTYLKANAWLLRYDSTAKTVLGRADTIEFVLYNFALGQGDTIHTGLNGEFHHIVTNIDSVLLNSHWHKVWHFGSHYNTSQYTVAYYVIEGIGCNRGPLFPIQPIIYQSDSRLYCFSNDDGQPGVTPAVEWFDNLNSCLLNVGKLSFANNIEVHPIPAHGKLFIDLPERANANMIELVDIVGKKVIGTNCQNGQSKYQFDVSNVQAGIYLVRINTENGVVTKKVEIL